MIQPVMTSTSTSPIVVGHNGSSEADSPSGSLDAYRSAIAVGAGMVEIDMRLTRDRLFVGSYPDVIEGTPISEWKAADLPDGIPLVADVLSLAREAGIPVLLDLKDTGCEDELIELATSVLTWDQFRITTLEDASVAKITKAYPEARVALNLGRGAPPNPIDRVRTRISELFPVARARACGARFLTLNYRHAALGTVRRGHAAGFPIFVWTVDEPSRMARWLADRRVEGIITNRPATAMRVKETLARNESG
jgi:glycerophosphoryl diester phosphodiesterase